MTRTHNRGAHAGKRSSLLGTFTVRPPQRPAPGGRPGGRRRAGGPPAKPSRLRSARVRIVAAVVATAFLVTGIALGWADPDPSAEPTVQGFLLDWENGDYAAAAVLTTAAPGVVTSALSAAYRQLGADDMTLAMGPITQKGSIAQATFQASVDLGHGGAPWNYQGEIPLRRAGSGWKIAWSPSVIAPGLRPGLRLAVVSSMPQRAQLLDATGIPLSPEATVVSVGVIPGQLTDPAKTASGLAGATGLSASQILGWISEAPTAGFLELVRFTPGQYSQVAGKLSGVPGLITQQQQSRLFGSIADPVTGSVGGEATSMLQEEGVPYRPGTTVGLSGLQQAYQRNLVGSPTTQVVEEDASGRVVSVLKSWPGHQGTNVRTTINSGVQQAADNAVDAAPGSAAIVAVSSTTGQVLAVAENTASGMPAVDPLDGHYQPGQAFTIVSAEALLASGTSVSAPIPCGTSNQVGGQNFTNSLPVTGLGVLPTLSADFAGACTTAFAGLSLKLTASQLQTAATGFGLGDGWQLPLTSFAGSIAKPAGQAEIASETTGQQGVLVSPLDMAMVAAVADSGTRHSPTLVTGTGSSGTSGPASRASLSPSVLSGLQAMMRQTVTSGAGSAADVPGAPVYGEVGTAALGTGGLQANWFVGYQKDVAFAVLEFSPSASASAASLAGQFLRNLG
jgi:cell division protein FtsI/penicillin-binding protein 2